jgi:diadenosine tetraphosphate (Ap4A) HIT family hydrolase
MYDMVVSCRTLIEDNFRHEGYNIGFNAGEVADQTVFHSHCHVILHYTGDVPEPKGGMRGVVPERRGRGKRARGHLACAGSAGAIFLTTDDSLIKSIKKHYKQDYYQST